MHLHRSVAGMDAAYLDHESQYFTVLEGEFDAERFAQGGYLIYNRSLYVNDMEQTPKINQSGFVLAI